MRKSAADGPNFLNVAFVVYSNLDLEPLVAAMGRREDVLFLGREHRANKACLRVSGMPRTPEAAIRRFCKLINALPPSARKLWFSARSRIFDVGIDSVPKGSYWFEISAQTTAEAAKLDAIIAVTVYGKLKKLKLPRKPLAPGARK
jgi:hypothetical protein